MEHGFDVCGQVVRYVVNASAHLFHDVTLGMRTERELRRAKVVEKHARGPDVGLHTVKLFSLLEQLRCHVHQRATLLMQKLIAERGKPEVNQFDLTLDRVKYDVLQLYVPMGNFVLLQRLDGQKQLSENLNSLLERELLLSLLIFAYRVQTLSCEHLHYEVDLVDRFNTLV